MQETDKILKRLDSVLNSIDDKLKKIASKPIKHSIAEKNLEKIHKAEEEIDKKGFALDFRIRELELEEQTLTKSYEKALEESVEVQAAAKWIESEAKKQFCKDLVYEIIYKTCSILISKDQQALDQSKMICHQTYTKLEKSLSHFEKLKTNLELEALSIPGLYGASLPPHKNPVSFPSNTSLSSMLSYFSNNLQNL
ncbi:hypothetical protein SteCoe_5371 [Stentor coeruleus]|uniref:Uncharacterized protein n=1 Tax=Stentor coeruleus TaxID=5963 RepID=A0A1R2CSJ8_9CILI|nr:hypothetical protein SteCoe_5371 [Stentor coeruleus]